MVRAAAVAVIRGVSDGFSKALARTPVPLNVARAKLQHKAYVQAMTARVSEVLQVATIATSVGSRRTPPATSH